jgi:hypothetical protein
VHLFEKPEAPAVEVDRRVDVVDDVRCTTPPSWCTGVSTLDGP